MTGSRIETFFLAGPAGRLECFLKHPAGVAAGGGAGAGGGIGAGGGTDANGGGAPGAAAIVCHPHPLFGGTMHNKVVHAAAEALVGLGLPTVRFNFRGVGRSGGSHDGGRGEADDVRAVLDDVSTRFPGAAVVLAGYSFGAFVGLRAGCADPRVAALIGIAAPVGLYNFGFLRDCVRPLAFIQGEADPLAPLGLVLTLAAALPGGARVLPIAGAEHSFAGHLTEVAERVAEAVPEALRPPR